MDFIHNKKFHFIGLKGSGMCALALLLHKLGKHISGSDIADFFYTDELLRNAGLRCSIGFKADNIPIDTDIIIYSSAYTEENNEELALAKKTHICLSYPQALGKFSEQLNSCAVIGTHGKTTTSALIGTIAKALRYPIMALTGGKVSDWENNTVWFGGDKVFVAEACEYRNNFMHFKANYAIYTSAELDHPDFFENKQAVIDGFTQFLSTLETPKILIACVDDAGVRKSLSQLSHDISEDITSIRYGSHIPQDTSRNFKENICDVCLIEHKISTNSDKKVVQSFRIQGLDKKADTLQWELPIPGKSLVLNAIGALILIRELHLQLNILPEDLDWNIAREALANFRGISRRCELLYKDDKYIVLDDYAHHPTAIKMTLEGIRNFYAPTRLIVDFMSHTYTRTAVLLDDFVKSLSSADIIIINDIYGSAREQSCTPLKENTSEKTNTQHEKTDKEKLYFLDGKKFSDKVKEYHQEVYYMPNFMHAAKWVAKSLQPGDLFVTMGAGDNFRIAQSVVALIESRR